MEAGNSIIGGVGRDGRLEGLGELTEREAEVLQLLPSGTTNRDIGDVLCLSEKTVEYHLRHIYGKLGVKNRTQAAMLAQRLGITNPMRQ